MKRTDELLLKWYDANKRSLPWRGTKDVYRIWISEIMLQQTRAETVKAYYARFLERFGNVFALADAEIDEVLKLWEGLGYYSRARNLHKAAKRVAATGGVFPDSVKGLEALPGIGPYAARAIASIAWNECAPALDGNQMRVLSRVMGIGRVLKTPFDLESEAMELISRSRAGDYNQALMDLGAGICTPKKPNCAACPLREICVAHQEDNVEFYPQRPTPIAKKEEMHTIFLIECGGGICIRRRDEAALLGGLYEFPNVEGHLTASEAERALGELGYRDAKVLEALPAAKHVFTHLIWKMQGYFCRASATPNDALVADAERFHGCAFPTALKKYREIAAERLNARAETEV